MTTHTDNDFSSLETSEPHQKTRARFWALLIGCVGVVYGDIGTSPLYAFREAVVRVSQDGIMPVEIYGILSLILWSLILVVTVKYVLFLLHVDNRGEGGVLSLMALAQKAVGKGTGFVFFAAITGAALFYGDAAITPAISVLSAMEGFKLVTPALDGYILPISMAILFVLFAVQRKGTGSVSFFFGPVTIVWFLAMAAAGISWIVKNPAILHALNPVYSFSFLFDHGVISFLVLGSVFLAVTGAEALYADLGHFGRKPIQRAWLFLVFPCLLLNYLGQGALLLAKPAALENPFFLLVPEWALLPLVILAAMATVIASQAVITGAFSLTRQAIQLGLLPRMEIRHTSETQEGQIYIPQMNIYLLIAVLFLCVTFGSSSALASAYGIAVTGTMVITSLMVFIVIARVWKKGYVLAAVVTAPFLVTEFVFLASNLMKVFDGGYVPLLFAGVFILMITTWVTGSRYLFRRSHRQSVPVTDLLEQLDRHPVPIVPGTAIFLTSDTQKTPEALMQNLKHNHVLHEKNVILTIVTAAVPRIEEDRRLIVESLSSHMIRIIVSFGYMETPDVTKTLLQARKFGLVIDMEDATYFLSRRKIVSDPRRGLPPWQDKIYIALSRTAVAATDFYKIPHNQVIEMGIQLAV